MDDHWHYRRTNKCMYIQTDKVKTISPLAYTYAGGKTEHQYNWYSKIKFTCSNGQGQLHIRWTGMPGDFAAIFYKRNNFCDFLFALLYTKALLKGIYSKRKEFAPLRSKLFPFRVERFSESVSLQAYPFCLNSTFHTGLPKHMLRMVLANPNLLPNSSTNAAKFCDKGFC